MPSRSAPSAKIFTSRSIQHGRQRYASRRRRDRLGGRGEIAAPAVRARPAPAALVRAAPGCSTRTVRQPAARAGLDVGVGVADHPATRRGRARARAAASSSIPGAGLRQSQSRVSSGDDAVGVVEAEPEVVELHALSARAARAPAPARARSSSSDDLALGGRGLVGDADEHGSPRRAARASAARRAGSERTSSASSGDSGTPVPRVRDELVDDTVAVEEDAAALTADASDSQCPCCHGERRVRDERVPDDRLERLDERRAQVGGRRRRCTRRRRAPRASRRGLPTTP